MFPRSFSFTLLLVVFVLFLPSFVSCRGKKYNLPEEAVVIQRGDGSTVSVVSEIASKEEERNYGFMNRKTIPDGTGMLFVFEKDQVLSFWMKNTPHPLSIAYITSQGVITDILDMTPFSLTPVLSSRSVRYALEVPQGWFKANNVSVGDSVTDCDGQSLRKFIP